MKKRLLIGTALFAAVSAFPQSGRTLVPKAGVRDFMAEKAQRASIGVNEPQVSPMNGAGLTPKGNLNYMRTSASQAATTVSWDLLCGSMNTYGMLVSTSRPLQYNPNVNAVSFIHRKSASYVTNPVLPTAAQSGVIVAEVSTNWGQSWDSTAIWTDATHWGRYPQGGIWAPPSTALSNAYVIGTGPTVSGSTWTGDFYASKQLNTFDNVGSTVPGAQQFISFTPTNTAIAPHGWSRNGFSVTDDGLVRSIAIIEDDFQGLSTVTGFAVVTGSFNSSTGTFDWSTETLTPNTMIKPDGNKYLSPDPQMAWNQSGTIGYVVASGVAATATLQNRSFQPIVWKMDRTLSSTPTWTQVPEIDFNDTASFGIITNHLAGQIATNGDTISLPFLNDYDITVDKYGKLHIGAIFMSGATDHPDSLNYYSQWSAHNNPGELYRWRHSPGNRPYIYDLITDGATGWKAMMIDSMSSEGPSSAVGYPGYTENPWDNTGDGGAKVTLESRLQLGRTPDGEYITVSWSESDSAFTNMQLKWNNLPNIKIRAIRAYSPTSYSVNIGPEQNMTGNDNDVFTRATLHYQSPTTGTAAVMVGVNDMTVNINTPLTVTNSNPYSQLTNNTTWYGAANVEYVFGKPLDVGVAQAAKSTFVGQLYPNPASGSAVFVTALNEAADFNIAVLNAVGQTVKQVNAAGHAGENQVKIDLTGLSSGIYFVNVKAGNFATTKKLIVK